MVEFALAAMAILYLVPGFVLLAHRPEGKNLSAEAAFVVLLWPLYVGAKQHDRES